MITVLTKLNFKTDVSIFENSPTNLYMFSKHVLKWLVKKLCCRNLSEGGSPLELRELYQNMQKNFSKITLGNVKTFYFWKFNYYGPKIIEI